MTRPSLTRQSVVAFVVGGLVVWLHQLGHGVLAAPPLTVDGALSWLERDPAIAVFVIVRVAAMVLGTYLVVLLALAMLARACHLWRVTRAIELLTMPWARGLVGGAALLGVMAAAPAVHRSPTGPPARAQETAVLHELAPSPDGSATLHPLDPGDAPAQQEQPAAPADDHAWVVAPGDSFWFISRAHLTETIGRDVSDAEVAAYSRQLIELNRDQLVNPSDPDLIYAGQVFALPAIASG